MYVATHYYHHQHRIPASARLISTEIDTPWQMSSYKYYSDSVSWSGSSDSEYAVREVHLFIFCFVFMMRDLHFMKGECVLSLYYKIYKNRCSLQRFICYPQGTVFCLCDFHWDPLFYNIWLLDYGLFTHFFQSWIWKANSLKIIFCIVQQWEAH